MGRWVCPRCEREFGRVNQSHVCVPGCTVDDVFARRPPVQRAIYDALMAHLAELGPVHVDAVGVGVFLKRDEKLAEVRPMARSLSLQFVLPRTLDDARVVRRMRISAGRFLHIVRLTDPGDVDETVRAWLAEAYLAAGTNTIVDGN
ncbi:MAG TPA: DUF5655 domain-containing protein [Pilimelia sp.]|nr:DUF5655 domain-containing protein [Pilimelia sp.]